MMDFSFDFQEEDISQWLNMEEEEEAEEDVSIPHGFLSQHPLPETYAPAAVDLQALSDDFESLDFMTIDTQDKILMIEDTTLAPANISSLAMDNNTPIDCFIDPMVLDLSAQFDSQTLEQQLQEMNTEWHSEEISPSETQIATDEYTLMQRSKTDAPEAPIASAYRFIEELPGLLSTNKRKQAHLSTGTAQLPYRDHQHIFRSYTFEPPPMTKRTENQIIKRNLMKLMSPCLSCRVDKKGCTPGDVCVGCAEKQVRRETEKKILINRHKTPLWRTVCVRTNLVDIIQENMRLLFVSDLIDTPIFRGIMDVPPSSTSSGRGVLTPSLELKLHEAIIIKSQLSQNITEIINKGLAKGFHQNNSFADYKRQVFKPYRQNVCLDFAAFVVLLSAPLDGTNASQRLLYIEKKYPRKYWVRASRLAKGADSCGSDMRDLLCTYTCWVLWQVTTHISRLKWICRQIDAMTKLKRRGPSTVQAVHDFLFLREEIRSAKSALESSKIKFIVPERNLGNRLELSSFIYRALECYESFLTERLKTKSSIFRPNRSPDPSRPFLEIKTNPFENLRPSARNNTKYRINHLGF